MEKFDKLDIKISGLQTDFTELDGKFDKLGFKMEKRFDKVMTHLDKLIGLFKKTDEEQTILSAHSKSHTDRIEKLEKKVFKAVQI